MTEFNSFIRGELRISHSSSGEYIFYKLKKDNPYCIQSQLKGVLADVKTRSKRQNDFMLIPIYKHPSRTLTSFFKRLLSREGVIYQLTIKEETYYITPCVILDMNKNTVLTIHNNCVFISPRVYTTNMVINAFILKKLLPEFISRKMTVIIKEREFAEKLIYKPKLIENLNTNVRELKLQ